MTENTTPENDLTSEFRTMADNLKTFLKSAWESDEAQNLHQEIKSGLTELGRIATETVDEFNASETGQRLKAEAIDFKARVESGEVEEKAREEIQTILKTINKELETATGKFAKSADETTGTSEEA
jgi:hypothetical protein